MGLCGSRAAGPSDDDAKSVTSVVPSQDSGGGLTEARLKEMYRQDSDYMEATGYGAVAMFCGGDAAKRLDDDCHSSDDDDDDGDVDDYYGHGRYGEYSSDGYSDAGSALSRQSSTDTLLSSRPGSAESFSSMSSVGSALDDGGGAPAMARVTAPGVATLGRNKGSSVKTFVSERQNSFEDRENEIANAIQEIKKQQEEKLRLKRERRKSLRQRELAMKQREEARRQGGVKLPPLKKGNGEDEGGEGAGDGGRKKKQKKMKKKKKTKEMETEVQNQERAQTIISEYENESHALQRSRSMAQDNQKRRAQARRNRAFFQMDNKSSTG
jgi:hypothetical protein